MILESAVFHVDTSGPVLSWLIQGSSSNSSLASLQKSGVKNSFLILAKPTRILLEGQGIHLGFVADKVALRHVFLLALQVSFMNAPYPSIVILTIRGWRISHRSTKRLTVTHSYYWIFIIIQRVKKFPAFIEPESSSHMFKKTHNRTPPRSQLLNPLT
jgi:hypothetical protein